MSRRHHLFWYFSGGDSSLPSPWKFWPWQFWFWIALLTIHQRLLVRNHMGQIILWWFTFFFEHRRKFTQCSFFLWRSFSLSSFKSNVVNLRAVISAASLTSSSPNSALATLRVCIMNQGIHIIHILYHLLCIMRRSLWRNAYFTLYFLHCTLYLSFSRRVILILCSWKGSKSAGTEQ